MNNMTYTAWGPVRGGCRHAHKSHASAAKCAAQDREDCRELGGGAYSDRHAHRADCMAVRAPSMLSRSKCNCEENTYHKQKSEG